MPKNIYVASSPVHGKGVFAARVIKEGEVLGRYVTRKTTLTAEENIFVVEIYDEDGELFEHRLGINDWKYINHSTRPNIDMVGDELKMVALHSIEKDEELTWYYGAEFEESMKCDSD